MFSLKSFIKNGLLKAIGEMADYKIILNAAGWLDKGVLDESDLAEIQAAIETHEITIEPTESVIEEPESIPEHVIDDPELSEESE